MRLDVITIFPEYLDPLRHALLGKAIETGRLSVGVHNLRQWATGVHKSVDDTPFGGGPGMVMKPAVWGPAIDDVVAGTGPAAGAEDLETSLAHRGVQQGGVSKISDANPATVDDPLIIVPTPAGVPFTQEMAAEWSTEQHVVFACGRYEGIDQRVVDDAQRRYRVQEVSIGDYVLIGGEVAVLVMAEAMVRLIPGVLGNQASHQDDSFQDGLLEGPSYTKPREWRELSVPDVLFSGNHAKVARWRRDEALRRTAERRPELIEEQRHLGNLSKQDEQVLTAELQNRIN